MKDILRNCPIVPVITVNSPDEGLRIAQSLVNGGIKTLEIVLRTDTALAALELIATELPNCAVGAGTVINSTQVGQAKRAGASFIVSPGCNRKVIEAAQTQDLPILPGVATASDILLALEHELTHLKLFPANLVGGIPALKAFGAVFPQVRFCPTGGINLANLKEFFSLKNVIAVGGSWLVPEEHVRKADWQGITELAQQSLSLLE